MFNMCSLPKFDNNQVKSSVNALMVPISKICKDMYIKMLESNISALKNNPDTKLEIYGNIKTLCI